MKKVGKIWVLKPRKLYIIIYPNYEATWHWAISEQAAKKDAKESEEVDKESLQKAQVFEIDEALNKYDLIKFLNKQY